MRSRRLTRSVRATALADALVSYVVGILAGSAAPACAKAFPLLGPSVRNAGGRAGRTGMPPTARPELEYGAGRQRQDQGEL
jgi:hypothetical protein